MPRWGAPRLSATWAVVMLAALGAGSPVSAQSAALPGAAPEMAAPAALDPADFPDEPPVAPTIDPPGEPVRVVMGARDVIRESIFGPAPKEDWHPLSLATFFTEGWDEAYVKSPEGTNGASKQNWLGARDGIFARLNAVSFYYTNGMTDHLGLLLTPAPWAPAKPKTNGNEYLGVYTLYVPLNQRMELVLAAPFIASNKGPHGYVGNFGDLTLEARFRLIEQRNFSLTGSVYERAPTGNTVNGNNINFVTPDIDFWWNFAPKWVARGGTGINIDTGRPTATDVYFNNLAVGRYLTTKGAVLFKQLVVYTSTAVLTDVGGRKGYITDVYIQPGLRFGLDGDQKWFVMASVLAPVSGPHPYAWQPSFSLVRNY